MSEIREADCPGCDTTTEYYIVRVATDNAELDRRRMKRKKCHACEKRLKPKETGSDWLYWGVMDRDHPGLVVLVCLECATYCDDCRYVFND